MMNRLNHRSKTHLAVSVLWFCTGILLLAACSSNKDKKNPRPASPQKQATPSITWISTLPETAKPNIFLLDTMPKPVVKSAGRQINMPLRKGGNEEPALPPISQKPAILTEARGRGFFTTYSTDDGLGLDQVNCSYKDKWGSLWFGTNGGGVSRWDGTRFTTYTTAHGLANNVIWCIVQDHEDNLWFGTDGSGASKYDGQTFTTYTTAQGLPDNVIFSIVEDEEKNLWFGSFKGGVSKWNGKAFTNYSTKQGLAANTVKAILADNKGNHWFAGLGGVSKWDGRSFVSYTTSEGLSGNKVWCAATDNAGNLWFGTEGKGLCKWDGSRFTTYPVFDEAANDLVYCLKKDRQGNLWLGTQKGGMIKFDGKTFVRYSTANGLPNNQIRTLAEDERGGLWLGTFGSGVSKFAGNSFTNFTNAQGLSSNLVFSVEEDAGTGFWLGTAGGGVCWFNQNGFASFTQADGLVSNEIYAVLKDRKGNRWFGGAGGLSKYDGQAFTNFTPAQGLPGNTIFCLAEDRNDNLWLGTSGGLSKYDGKRLTNYTKQQGLAGDVVFSIRQDSRGNLWFGTWGGGVSKFDGTAFTNYTTEQGLSDNVVWAITEDKRGNLWFATQQGLSLMPAAKITQTTAGNRSDVFTGFTTSDGLPNNFVTQVIQGGNDTLYVGTNLGLCELLPASQTSSPKGWRVGRTFNSQHGYPVKDVNAGLNAMFKDSRGLIWIGTGSDKTGLVRFEPAALANASNFPPKVFINQVKINNEAVGWQSIGSASNTKGQDSANDPAIVAEQVSLYGRTLSAVERDSLRTKFKGLSFDSLTKWQPLPQHLVVPYDFNNVGIEFSAVEPGKSFPVAYRYFLEGYDKEWSPPVQNTFASFGNISEGRYTFLVKAQSPDGVWGQPVSFRFDVLPPWWRAWWMLAVYGALLLTAILLFSRWRHRRILSQKKILEHKVAVATKQVREETEKVQAQKMQLEQALQNLTETQAQLVQAEKMASLGQLTAGIAHEIQNPLNFVNNFSEVSRELLDEMNEEIEKGNYDEAKAVAGDVKQNLEKIGFHGKRADAIVKGMLQHSRKSSEQKEPTDINALCDEYLRLAYHGLRAKDKSFTAKLETDFDQTVGKVNVVPQELGRVILNLITNAFYAVNEKAKQSPNGYLQTVWVRTKREAGKVSILVRDNGSGIPEKLKDKIFQPFFTTKPTGQGTGLGLSLSYDIITNGHGGELKVETKEGEGTAFIINLPA